MGSTQVEKAKIDQVVSEFFAKSLHIILDSRIPYLSSQNHLDESHHSPLSFSVGPKSPNRWFNLEMDNCAAVVECVEPWKRGSGEPMVVDVLLQQPLGGGDAPSPSSAGPRYGKGGSPCRGQSSGDSWSGDGEGCASPGGLCRTLLERWVVQYVPRKKVGNAGGGSSCKSPGAAGFGDGSAGAGVAVGGSVASGKGGGGGGGKGAGGGPPLPYPSSHVVEGPVVYKRTMIMLRSLYCTMRTLPAHRLFRLVNSSSHSRSFSLSYRVSSCPPPLSEVDEGAMITCNLTPIETMWGRMCISGAYRHTTAVTALEITPPILPRIISDYVGSPTTDPLRRFPRVGSVPSGGISGRRGVHVVSLPSSVPSSPSGPAFGRRHSWSSGHGNVKMQLPSPTSRASRSPSPSQPVDFNPSPPMAPSPHSSSPLNNLHLHQSPRTSPSRPSFPRPFTSQPSSFHQVGSGNPSQPIPIQHGQTPSSSPSPSPSPPTPSHYNGHNRSAPVSIPRPSSARPYPGSSPRHLLAEGPSQVITRSPYPPPSPNRNVEIPRNLSTNARLWTGQVPNIFVPSLDGKVTQRLSFSTLAESSLLVSPPHPYHPNQVDEKGEEGPPSGVKRSLYGPPRLLTLGSRGLGKIDSNDDGDEEEFSCPFAVDDDEAEDYRSRMDSPRVRQTSDTFEAIGQGHHRSQDAAVGALVRILKSAPPLRQWSAPPGIPGSPSSRPSLFPSLTGQAGMLGFGKMKNSPPRPSMTKARSGSGSLVGSPESPLSPAVKISQKTSGFALEELRGYVEMRDHLLRQSGGKLASSPAKPM